MKVFAFINGSFGGGDVVALAVAESGIVVGQHVSSSERFAKMDIGAEPGTFQESKLASYRETLGEDIEVEWVDDPQNHEGVLKAQQLNQAMHEHELAQEEAT